MRLRVFPFCSSQEWINPVMRIAFVMGLLLRHEIKAMKQVWQQTFVASWIWATGSWSINILTSKINKEKKSYNYFFKDLIWWRILRSRFFGISVVWCWGVTLFIRLTWIIFCFFSAENSGGGHHSTSVECLWILADVYFLKNKIKIWSLKLEKPLRPQI